MCVYLLVYFCRCMPVSVCVCVPECVCSCALAGEHMYGLGEGRNMFFGMGEYDYHGKMNWNAENRNSKTERKYQVNEET